MSFTVQIGPVLAARLNSMSCSYWSSQASSRKGLSCMRAPRRKSLALATDSMSRRADDFFFMRDEAVVGEQFAGFPLPSGGTKGQIMIVVSLFHGFKAIHRSKKSAWIP